MISIFDYFMTNFTVPEMTTFSTLTTVCLSNISHKLATSEKLKTTIFDNFMTNFLRCLKRLPFTYSQMNVCHTLVTK